MSRSVGGDVLRTIPGGVLAVHAHPDDETLSTGALLASCAAAGVPALVVTCTRGERGEVLALPGTTSEGLDRLAGDAASLASHRVSELARAVRALGGGRPGAVRQAFLDDAPDAGHTRFEDSGMVWVAPGVAGPDPDVAEGFSSVPLDVAAGRLAQVIRAERPDVVATYEAGGGYGHPDHVRAHQVAARGVELAADPAWATGASGAGDEPSSPALWVRVAAAGALRAEREQLAADHAARALARTAALTFPAAGETLPAVARDDEVLARAAMAGELVEIDVAPVLPAVVAAMRAHATQIQHATATSRAGSRPGLLGWYALSNGVLAPIGAVETYLVAGRGGRGPTSVGSAR